MYWGQAAIALVVAIATGYAVAGTGRGPVVAGATALTAYIIVRWFFAWVFRIRYWYKTELGATTTTGVRTATRAATDLRETGSSLAEPADGSPDSH